MKAKKALALILVLVMVLGLLTVTASADTAGSLGSPTNGIKSITISGANINNNEDRTLTGSSAPYNLTYNVKLASGTADGTVVTATFEKENASNENLVVSSAKPNSILNAVSRKHIKKHASLTYNATVQNGTATMTVMSIPIWQIASSPMALTSSTSSWQRSTTRSRSTAHRFALATPRIP